MLKNVTLDLPENPQCPKCGRRLYRFMYTQADWDCVGCGRKYEEVDDGQT